MTTKSLSQEYIEPIDTMGFNRFDLEYWKSPNAFSSLLSGQPNIASAKLKIENRKDYLYRTQITSILRKQYQHHNSDSNAFKQIEKLNQENTFTVICAHQPCLFGGPAYWAYKILSVIKLCKSLSKSYPDYNFIPVYFSGNEDHDFEEINHINIFHNRLVWNETSGMSTGILPIDGLVPVLEELEGLFTRNDKALLFLKRNKDQLKFCDNYSDYFRFFVDALFGDRGLIYFNPNDAEAKNLFAPIIKLEITCEFISAKTSNANSFIQSLNLPLQVNPRELNLLYHHTTGRKRIIKKDGIFELVDTDVRWTEEQILSLLESDSKNFSPNVLLRPMYQEFLFPNIAFVGGGGEIAYWMQLRECFEHVSIPYPLIFRRLSAFQYDQSVLTKIAKTVFQAVDFLKPQHDLEKEFINLHATSVLSIDEQLDVIQNQLNLINKASKSLDDPTQSSIEGEIQKINKSLDQIKSRRNKVIKHKYEQDIQNLQKIKEVLFPNNSIQERVQSFLPMYFKYGEDYFDLIENAYHPGVGELSLFYENKMD